jgi:hypothetical protein
MSYESAMTRLAGVISMGSVCDRPRVSSLQCQWDRARHVVLHDGYALSPIRPQAPARHLGCIAIALTYWTSQCAPGAMHRSVYGTRATSSAHLHQEKRDKMPIWRGRLREPLRRRSPLIERKAGIHPHIASLR